MKFIIYWRHDVACRKYSCEYVRINSFNQSINHSKQSVNIYSLIDGDKVQGPHLKIY